jgi:hypothetical protein
VCLLEQHPLLWKGNLSSNVRVGKQAKEDAFWYVSNIKSSFCRKIQEGLFFLLSLSFKCKEKDGNGSMANDEVVTTNKKILKSLRVVEEEESVVF